MNSELLFSIVGAIIGSVFTLVGILMSHYLSIKSKKDDEEDNINAFLKSIYYEIETIWDNYSKPKDSLGKKLSNIKENKFIFYKMKLSQDYFIIYKENISWIGKISNKKIMKKIISVYFNLNEYIDFMKYYTTLVEQYEDLIRYNYEIESYDEIREIQVTSLKYNTKLLKSRHLVLEKKIKELLVELDKVTK